MLEFNATFCSHGFFSFSKDFSSQYQVNLRLLLVLSLRRGQEHSCKIQSSPPKSIYSQKSEALFATPTLHSQSFQQLKMAEAVVSLVLETLRDLLLEETIFLSGVQRQVKGLETQLKEMKCLLEDTDRRQYESKIIRQWIAEIRNLSYEAEDAIEMYAFESSSKRAYYGFIQAIARYSCGLNKGFALHGIGSQISEITSGIEGVTTMMEGYGLKSIIQGESSVYTDNNQRGIKQTYPFEIDDYFIGMEDDLRQLVSLMVDDKKHRVISIWGMGEQVRPP